jgi:hypothetical protein
VVVLVLLVLMLGIILAFFSQSILQKQISKNSANQAALDLLVQGAENTIIGDFKSEIADGSPDNYTWTTAIAGKKVTLFRPKAPVNASPALGFRPAITGGEEVDGLANLIRTSSGSRISPSVPVRWSTMGSSEEDSKGRFISPSRWNLPLLLTPANPGSRTDLTPRTPIDPKWIYVDRTGGTPTTFSPNMKWAAPGQSTGTVIGRYAYAIYNEGGLANVNVAGFPAAATAPQKTALSFKNSPAFADLTVLPGMTANLNDAIFGWKNQSASSGAYPGYSTVAILSQVGDPVNRRNKFSELVNNDVTGLLSVPANSTGSAASDHRFTSRQQLISFLTNSGEGIQNVHTVLEYLGTFSRDLDQPSLWPDPDPTRPRMTKTFTVNGSYPGGYNGGNNAPADDLSNDAANINPPFLKIRAGSNFDRVDGSRASPGEPLIKRRFPLNRLAWLTYKGYSADNKSDPVVKAYTDAGIPADFIGRGTEASVEKSFGLEWKGGKWVYDIHNGGSGPITRLGDIVGREPDFIELLKAALSVGSKAKGSGVTGDPVATYQITRDTALDFAIIQIAANIIDQFDPDGYPTQIQFTSGSITRTATGIENLPYMAWFLSGVVQAIAPKDATDLGLGVSLVIPVIWNPHTKSSPLGSPYPNNLRYAAVSTDPEGGNSRIPQMLAKDTASSAQAVISPGTAWTEDNTAIEFSANDASRMLFREPTMLYEAGKPAGSGLRLADTNTLASLKETYVGTAHSGRVVGTNSGLPDAFDPGSNPASGKYVGLYGGQYPLAFMKPSTTVPPGSGTLTYYNQVVGVSHPFPTSRLQYQNSSGTWVTYDECYTYEPFFTTSFVGGQKSSFEFEDRFATIGFDPRTSRWGVTNRQGFAGDLNRKVNQIQLDATNHILSTLRPSDADPSRANNFELFTNAANPLDTAGWNYQSGQLRHGLFTQNSRKTVGSHFYTDPDGVVRRAMAAFASPGSAVGYPMALAYYASTTLPKKDPNGDNRPIMLNRPFRSVAELGCVFSGTPWKNLDMSTPESGDAGLLDVFTIADDSRPDPLVAGKIDLNTRQWPVLQALLKGAYRDEYDPSDGSWISEAEAKVIAKKLVDRTAADSSAGLNKGPLANLSEVVGRYVKGYTNPATGEAYDGLISDIAVGSSRNDIVQRFVEAVTRALAGGGTTRVWNVMIDVIAQTGRFPSNADNFKDFVIDGERRYWIHLAIDRYTGEVIDRQVELVQE